MRRYAEATAVPISKSRGEIDSLLRSFGAAGVSWADNFESGSMTLRFAWRHEGRGFTARIEMSLEHDDDLRARAADGRSGAFSERKFDRLREARGRSEHRLLLLWLKAAFNAVNAGIVKPEALFLPFLEGSDGRTVAEVALPQLAALSSASAEKLLPPQGARR